MANETQEPNADEASKALTSVQHLTTRGLKRGLYPRWYAVAISLWGGTLAATIGTLFWPLVFAGGLLAHYLWRKKTDAWIKEIRSRRDLWVVLALSAVGGSVFVGAYIAQAYFNLTWVPLLAGVMIAALLFSLTEISYRSLRTKQYGE